MRDICPSRDMAQPHIMRNGRCTLCMKGATEMGNDIRDHYFASEVYNGVRFYKPRPGMEEEAAKAWQDHGVCLDCGMWTISCGRCTECGKVPRPE